MTPVGCRPFARTSTLVVLLAALGATVSCRQIVGLQPMPMPCADPLMIDDMEDGTPAICDSGKRHGTWYGFGDGTSGTQTLAPNATIPGGRGSSQRAVEFTGGGYTSFGAIVGVALNEVDLSPQPYSADSVGGVTFWMKSNVPVTVQVPLTATALVKDGGQCIAGSAPNNCNNHFAFQITAPTSTWTQYYVPFSALRQLQDGTATWDPSQLLGVEFLVGPGANFDLWIDDIAFYYCASTECKPTCTAPKFPVQCAVEGVQPAGCYVPGTDCQVIATWCGDPQMIDDMEDGDNNICPTAGRFGIWWTASDATSTDLKPAVGSTFTQTPIPGGRGTSRTAAHLAGSGFTGWGALMAFDLTTDAGYAPYDASAADGITFWAKTSANGVGFEVNTLDTVPAKHGGTCVDSATTVNCNQSWQYWVEAPEPDTWFQVSVPFAALAQIPGASQTTGNLLPGSATWDPTRVVNVQQVAFAGPVTPNGPAPFDLWIDDIALYTCEPNPCLPTCNDPDLPTACPGVPGQLAGCWPAGADCANRPPRPWQYNGVWGSGPNDVWVVGASLDGLVGIAFHWDGATWTRGDVGNVPPLWAVSGQGPDDVWAVADHGTVARWDGSTWRSTTEGTDASLSAVRVGGPDDVWVAAYPGTLQHWDGSAWSTGTSNPVRQREEGQGQGYGLWGSGPNNLWSVGGTILHFDGTSWSSVATPAGVYLNRVWGSGPNDVWAVGSAILHFDGSSWVASSFAPTGYVYDVWGSGPSDVWAVGQGSSILHWDGAAWSAVPSPSKFDLYAVWGSGPSDVWAVGDSHAVIHFDGVTWSSVTVVGQTP
jgi:hypothetical protein